MPSVLSPYEPVSSGEIRTIDLDRAEEVERRHRLLAEFLDLQNLDALLLRRPANFSWLTAGGSNVRSGGQELTASLFITPDARVVVCNAVESGQIFDREVPGLGFQLKERPWHERPDAILEDLCRGRRVASDCGFAGTPSIDSHLRDFRIRLSERDRQHIRKLGRALTTAVEATARTFDHGETENEVAGQLAHRLMRHGITPVRLQVFGDGQGYRYRHWSHGDDPIERHCIISVVGRQHGLHVGVTRSICFGQPPQQIEDMHDVASLVLATGMFFTQCGWQSSETFKRVARIYEKFGAAEEWQLADQADVLGYGLLEYPLTPTGQQIMPSGTAVFWHPSVQTVAVGETMIVHPDGLEHVTRSDNWPMLSVQVKSSRVECAGILCRESDGSWKPSGH